MIVRDFATFESDLESLERTGVDDESAPGSLIAARLVSRLRQAGAEVSHDVTPWEGYAWEFGVRSGRVIVTCVLQASDSWLLITRPGRSLLDRIRGRDFSDEHQSVCLAVDEVLRNDPEVRNVRWYTRSEFEGTGRPGAQ